MLCAFALIPQPLHHHSLAHNFSFAEDSTPIKSPATVYPDPASTMADNNSPFADPPYKELCLWCIWKRGKLNSVNRTLKRCLPSIADKLEGLPDNVYEAADDLPINFESHKPVKSKSHSITYLFGIARRRSITLHLPD